MMVMITITMAIALMTMPAMANALPRSCVRLICRRAMIERISPAGHIRSDHTHPDHTAAPDHPRHRHPEPTNHRPPAHTRPASAPARHYRQSAWHLAYSMTSQDSFGRYRSRRRSPPGATPSISCQRFHLNAKASQRHPRTGAIRSDRPGPTAPPHPQTKRREPAPYSVESSFRRRYVRP